MQDLAQAIVRHTFEFDPLPLYDANALFDRIAEWVQEGGEDPVDRVMIAGRLTDWAHERVGGVRFDVTNRYYDAAYRRFNDGYRALLVNTVAEAGEIAAKAIADFRREFAELPARLRRRIRPEGLERECEGIRADLVKELSLLVRSRGPKEDHHECCQRRYAMDFGNFPAMYGG
jgi:hypothetical protein